MGRPGLTLRSGAATLLTSQSVPNMTPATPTAPRQRRKEARPQELLEAALKLFVERGFAAARMEEVAALAGVSKGTLYLYYPSKEELLKAVIRERLANEIEAGDARSGAARGQPRRPAAQPARALVAARLRQPGLRRVQAHHHRGAQLSGDRRVLLPRGRRARLEADRRRAAPGHRRRRVPAGRRRRRGPFAGAADGDAVPAQALARRVRTGRIDARSARLRASASSIS